MSTIEIFCCYARKDQHLLQELKIHLMPLQRQGHITIWSDTDIGAGTEWEHEIDKHINTADVILLLISPDFIASNYCYSVEMSRALERHKAGEVRVIPVILRPVNWEETPISELQILPTEGKPVTSWSDHDKAFQDVARGIGEVVRTLPFLQFIHEGDIYYRSGRYEEALVAYNKALDLNHMNIELYMRKGSTLLRLKRYQEALVTFEQPLQLDPAAVPAAYYGIARALEQMGRRKEAQMAYKLARKLDYDKYLPTPTSTPLKTLQTFCNAAKAADYQTQWNQFLYQYRILKWNNILGFASSLKGRDDSHGGVANCAITNVIQNGSYARGAVTIVFADGRMITMTFQLVKGEDGVWRIYSIKDTQWK